MNFVNKKNFRNQLCNTVINVLVHNFVDFKAEFSVISVFLGRFTWDINERKSCMANLWFCICDIKVVQCNILNNFFLNHDFWNWNIFLFFQVELCCIRIGTTYALNCTTGSFNVDYITPLQLFISDCFCKYLDQA